MKDNATRLKIHKWVEIEPRGTKLSLQVNPEELAAVEKLDGCYALRTDLSPTAGEVAEYNSVPAVATKEDRSQPVHR